VEKRTIFPMLFMSHGQSLLKCQFSQNGGGKTGVLQINFYHRYIFIMGWTGWSTSHPYTLLMSKDALNQGWATSDSVLEGQCPTEFSSNPEKKSPGCNFLVIQKTLISLCQKCLIRVEAKLCRTMALLD